MDKLDKIAKEIAFAGRCKHDVSKDAQEFWDNTAEASRNVFLRQADAAIKTLPDMVQPLEWEKIEDWRGFPEGSCYEACAKTGQTYVVRGDWLWMPKQFEVEPEPHADPKAAAQAHYTAQIMKALGVSDE